MPVLRTHLQPTRRAVLRASSVAATALVSSGVLAACAGQTATGDAAAHSSALPGPTAGDIVWQASSETVTTGGQATHQFGVQLFNAGYNEMLDWWLEGWGTTKMNAAGTLCTANNPKGVDCLAFLQGLNKAQIAQPRSVSPVSLGLVY